MEPRRVLDRLWRVIPEGGRGWSVRPADERRRGARCTRAKGTTKALPSTRPASSSLRQRSGGIRQGCFACTCFWKPGDAAAIELVSAATRGMPQGMVISDQFAPVFSKDGQRLFAGGATSRTRRRDGAPEPRGVDVWHWKDPLLQPMQRVRAQQERNRSYRAVVHLADKRFVQLATRSADRQCRRRSRARPRTNDAIPAGDFVGRQLWRCVSRRSA